MKKIICIKVNGKNCKCEVNHHTTLLEVLREDLGLTGTKEGCGAGDCGACTVIVNGDAINSCIYLAVEADGKEILTVEGLAHGSDLHPLQQAFIDEGAVQCGYCTPGMLMTAKALLDKNADPTEAEIKRGIAGNICRCTGYVRINKAIMKAAQNTNNSKE